MSPELPQSPLAAPEGALSVPDELPRYADPSLSDQDSALADLVREISQMLDAVLVEVARIQGRVRRLELRPVITVDYREGL